MALRRYNHKCPNCSPYRECMCGIPFVIQYWYVPYKAHLVAGSDGHAVLFHTLYDALTFLSENRAHFAACITVEVYRYDLLE